MNGHCGAVGVWIRALKVYGWRPPPDFLSAGLYALSFPRFAFFLAWVALVPLFSLPRWSVLATLRSGAPLGSSGGYGVGWWFLKMVANYLQVRR